MDGSFGAFPEHFWSRGFRRHETDPQGPTEGEKYIRHPS